MKSKNCERKIELQWVRGDSEEDEHTQDNQSAQGAATTQNHKADTQAKSMRFQFRLFFMHFI